MKPELEIVRPDSGNYLDYERDADWEVRDDEQRSKE